MKEPETPVGANELRVVRNIEDSMKNSRGPRIQVIKSRDIINAEHFSEKVFRVLKMHGFKLQELTVESLKEKPEEDTSGSNLIYSISEKTIKDFLGQNLEQVEKPMKYLFDNSMLAYLRRPVLISTVSDSFYSKVGLQNFVASSNSTPGKKVVKDSPARKSGTNRLTIFSFYFAALSFALSGINNLAGNILVFTYGGSEYTPVIFAVLVLSLAAISLRAFSLGNEDKRSLAPATVAILLFIVVLLLGMVTSYYNLAIATAFFNTEGVLFSTGSNMVLVAIAFAVMVASLSKYVLFLGANSGRMAYILSTAGIALIIVVVLISNLPYITIFGQTLTGITPPVGTPPSLPGMIIQSNFAFNPEIPLFGVANYFSTATAAQYSLLRNYLLLLANMILSVSYFLAVRAQKSESSQPKAV